MATEADSEFDREAALDHARQMVRAGMDPERAMREAGLRPNQMLSLPKRTATADAKEFREYVTRLLRSMAPRDFGGLPIYVGMQSELPPLLQSIQGCGGFTSWSLDELLRPHLGTRYEGRGVAMFLADVNLNAQLTKDEVSAGGVRTRLFFWSLLRTAIHEAAHILTRTRPLFGDELPPDTVAAETEATVADIDGVERKSQRAITPFLQHEWAFIRSCVHLTYRAECGGVRFDEEQIAAGEHYGLSDFSEYRRALGDEPQRMLDASFQEIQVTPLPDAFWALWCKDMRAYSDRLQDAVRKEIAESKRS